MAPFFMSRIFSNDFISFPASIADVSDCRSPMRKK